LISDSNVEIAFIGLKRLSEIWSN